MLNYLYLKNNIITIQRYNKIKFELKKYNFKILNKIKVVDDKDLVYY